MEDESDNWFVIQSLTQRIFHDLYDIVPFLKKKQRTEKKKDIVSKFAQRLGPEFTEWEARLEQEFPTEIVREIVSDDAFWGLTIKLTGFGDVVLPK